MANKIAILLGALVICVAIAGLAGLVNKEINNMNAELFEQIEQIDKR